MEPSFCRINRATSRTRSVTVLISAREMEAFFQCPEAGTDLQPFGERGNAHAGIRAARTGTSGGGCGRPAIAPLGPDNVELGGSRPLKGYEHAPSSTL